MSDNTMQVIPEFPIEVLGYLAALGNGRLVALLSKVCSRLALYIKKCYPDVRVTLKSYGLENGYPDIIGWVFKNSPDSIAREYFRHCSNILDETPTSYPDICVHAAKLGHFEMAKWIGGQCPELIADMHDLAITYDHLEIVKWTFEQLGSPRSRIIVYKAIDHESLNVFVWALGLEDSYLALGNTDTEDDEEDGDSITNIMDFIAECALVAISTRKIKIFQWIVETGYSRYTGFKLDDNIFRKILTSVFPDFLCPGSCGNREWNMDRLRNFYSQSHSMGNYPFFLWVIENHPDWIPALCAQADACNRIDISNFLKTLVPVRDSNPGISN